MTDLSRWDPEMLAWQQAAEAIAAKYPPVRLEIPLEPHRLVNDAISLARGGGGADMAETTTALTRAGFREVEVRDRNEWYRDLARRELAALEGELRPLITERIGAERAAHFVDNWRQMVVVLERGELRPAHLKARKPSSRA